MNYRGNGTITLTFDTVVYNVKFSLFDIDMNARAQFSALDASGAGLSVTLSRATGSWAASIHTPNPATSSNTSVGTSPRVDAINTSSTNTSNTGTVNVDVAGPVKSITIVISNNTTDTDFWLSGISACVYGSFATNYFVDAKPFTGQPTFILATPDSTTVSYIDTATGQAKYLFTANLGADANAPRFLNGLGYDHKKHFLYYAHDYGTNAYKTRTLRRWDYNTETIDASMAVDVNALGIPTFDQGIESGGSSFYDGCLYFGVEGQNGARNSNRETIVWRIEFNASNIPVKSSQVFAVPADNGGGTFLIDWSDFVLKDGLLYNFNGIATATYRRYQHYNLQTGNMDNTYTPVGTVNQPRQAAITWSGALISTYDSIAQYNEAGAVILPKKKILGTTPAIMVPDWAKGVGPGGLNIGASGDATGPFKTKTDFGDAPATYDPATDDPATHERDSTLRLGGTFDREFVKVPTANADGDGADEDGISTVNTLMPSTLTNYQAVVSVYNNTGANATLIGWLDYNGNDVFDAGEGVASTVSSSTLTQNITLNWTGINVTKAPGTYTYLRIRITSASNSMTTSKPTGYFNNGEVEDYRVFVETILPSYIKNFNASVYNKNKVKLNWTADEYSSLIGYEVQKSSNPLKWDFLVYQKSEGLNNPGEYSYEITDDNPNTGDNYYRLKLYFANGQYKYSEIRKVNINYAVVKEVIISPNPARYATTIIINGASAGLTLVKIMNMPGEVLYSKSMSAINGTNKFEIPFNGNWQNGTYIVQVINDGVFINKMLVISK